MPTEETTVDTELNRLLTDAAPPSRTDDELVRQAARGTARAVASTMHVSVPRRKTRAMWIIGGAIVLATTGVTGAVAVPALMEWGDWQPDLIVEHEFLVTAEGTPVDCIIAKRVEPSPPDGIDDPDIQKRLKAASLFLNDYDAISLDASLADVAPDDLEGMRAQGQSDSLILASVINDKISAALHDEGLLGPGLLLTSYVRCGEVSE
jgi:hypothetical protein